MNLIFDIYIEDRNRNINKLQQVVWYCVNISYSSLNQAGKINIHIIRDYILSRNIIEILIRNSIIYRYETKHFKLIKIFSEFI